MKLTAELIRDVQQREAEWIASTRLSPMQRMQEAAFLATIPRLEPPPAPPWAVQTLIEAVAHGADPAGSTVLTETADAVPADAHARMLRALGEDAASFAPTDAAPDDRLTLRGQWEADSSQPGKYRRKGSKGHIISVSGGRWMHHRADGTLVSSGWGQKSLDKHVKQFFDPGAGIEGPSTAVESRSFDELTDAERALMYRRLAGEIDTPLPKLKRVLTEAHDPAGPIPDNAHDLLSGHREKALPPDAHERMARIFGR